MKKLKKDKLDNNQPIKKDTDVVKLIRKANRFGRR